MFHGFPQVYPQAVDNLSLALDLAPAVTRANALTPRQVTA